MKYKKCLISMILSLIMMLVIAQAGICLEWKTANQVTVAWDAVTTLLDGSPLPEGNTVVYNVYLANAATDPDKTNPALVTVSPIDTLEYTITLNVEGKFLVGIQALRYNEDQEMVGESSINWSDINGEYTPNPFGVRYYVPPEQAKNLRVK